MATYFGEIQELVSRATENDETDEMPNYNLSVETTELYTKDYYCNSMIVCVGEIAKAFSKCYIASDNHKQLLCVSYLSQHNESDSLLYGGNLKTQQSKIAASLYCIGNEVTVCEIPSKLPETIHVELLEIILQHINCSEAFVLTSAPIVTYKGDLPSSEVPQLMYLATSQFILPPNMSIPRLRAPNFITGIEAAVLTEFEVKKKSALCIVNYIESDSLDISNIQAYEKLTIINTFQRIMNTNNKSVLLNYVKKHFSASNLYI